MLKTKCKNCNKEFDTYPSRIKKGQDKYCNRKCSGEAHIGKTPWNKGLHIRFGGHKGLLDEKHPNWKGDNVKYRALHMWVEKRLGKPMCCDFCGITSLGRYHWANKSHEYKRDITDWIRLCPKCHKNYDKKGGD